MVLNGCYRNLGDPICIVSSGLSAYDLKKRRSRESISEVGLTHSRGVAGVMSCEIKDSLEGVSRNMMR